ncbi:MAG: hypothetical protein IAE94_15265 [Chthoniobacterales bacterium]|nr:hypothetical protein [Chthoniobacterales bacterium]
MPSAVRCLLLGSIFLPSVVFGCGIGWTEPKSHFEGVDYQGHVMHVEKLGDLHAGKGLSLPIFAVFTSHSGNDSPYAGHGWTVPLLESRMLQVDENGFKLDQPDGWFRMFGRDKNNPNILNGQGGWKAEIRGDTITAWADCGSKLVFNKGRLVSMQLKDRKFDFLYEGNRVSEIREGAMPVLRVEKEAISGEVTGLRLADNRQIGLERSERPRVQVINNQNLVGGMGQSLSKITRADGTVRTIDYAVDDKLNPTMKLGDRLIVWNPASKKIVKDGDWTYDIKAGAGPFDNAAIGRKNAQNQSEFWHRDGVKGEEIVQEIDGVKKRVSWFTSGKLAGKLRSRTIFESSNRVDQTSYSYDEKGRALREVFPTGDSAEYIYLNDSSTNYIKIWRMSNGLAFAYLYIDGLLAEQTLHDGTFVNHLKTEFSKQKSTDLKLLMTQHNIQL